jgi:hypothetical protein
MPELRKMKTSVYHPQGNSFLERKHQEISKLCRIYGLYPDELPDHVMNLSAQVCNILGIRYIPKKRRSKPDDVWSFIENLGVRNSKTDSIVAKDFKSGRISYLHPDDFKLVERPVILDWKINSKYLDIIVELGLDEKELLDYENPDFSKSWMGKKIYADVNCFLDLNEILDKAKQDKASCLLFVFLEWKESDVYKRFDYIKSELVRFPMLSDLCLTGSNQPVGLLNFDVWIGFLNSFDYEFSKDIDFVSLSNLGGYVVDTESDNDTNEDSERDT